jgi:hypothetical protein
MRKLRVVVVIGAAVGALACQPGRRETRDRDENARVDQPGNAGMPRDNEVAQNEPMTQPGYQEPGQGQIDQGSEQRGQTGTTGETGAMGQPGAQLSLAGEVKDSYGPQVFKVNLEEGGEVIVVTPRPMQGVTDGAEVAINGHMQQAGIAQIEQQIGVDISPDAEREIQNKGNVIVATSVQLKEERQRQDQQGQPGQEPLDQGVPAPEQRPEQQQY